MLLFCPSFLIDLIYPVKITTLPLPASHSNNTNNNIQDEQPFTICHSKTSHGLDIKAENILIVGGTSFMGSKLAVSLHERGYSVKVVDDDNSIPMEHMAWYRWQKLQDKGLSPKFVNLRSLNDYWTGHNKIDTVIFNPSPIFDGISSADTIELKLAIKVLQNFVHLLESIRSSNSKTQVMLLSLPDTRSGSFQKAWLKTMVASLSSYNRLYGMQTRLIKLDGVYGEWQGIGEDVHPSQSNSCLHIGKIEVIIDNILQQGGKNCIDIDTSDQCSVDSEKMAATLSWADEYSAFLNSRTDVVLSTYFTETRNPMYSYLIRSKSGLFMKQWFSSAIRLGLGLVIIHDNLDDETMTRIKTVHPNTDFVKVTNMKGRTPNDYRFYLFNDYLKKHPEIRYAVSTDMRDVKFFADPFKQMKTIGDYLYVGMDVSFFLSGYDHADWLRGVLRNCHKNDATIDAVKFHPFLNAGILGGTRHLLLAFLHQMTHYFDQSPHHLNCNMGTMTLVAHKHFNDYVYSGYPIQSSFKLGMEGSMPQGQAIKHKDTENYRF